MFIFLLYVYKYVQIIQYNEVEAIPTLEKAKDHVEAEDKLPEKDNKTPGIDASQRYHLHTTISMATWENLTPVDKKKLDPLSMWHLMRSELNMVAVGKTMYLSFISEMPNKAFVENNAVEIIE